MSKIGSDVDETGCATIEHTPLEQWHVRHLKYDETCLARPFSARLFLRERVTGEVRVRKVKMGATNTSSEWITFAPLNKEWRHEFLEVLSDLRARVKPTPSQ